MNKHGLKTSVGIKDKKIEDLETELSQYKSIKPKSPEGEALKAAFRVFISYALSVGLTYAYSRFPFMGDMKPEIETITEYTITLLVFMADKWYYQLKKNNGQVLEAVGIDGLIIALAKLFDRRKGSIRSVKNIDR